jgi:hypothetical protein
MNEELDPFEQAGGGTPARGFLGNYFLGLFFYS